MSAAADNIRAVDETAKPQTLYQAWKGHWPFRQWLYVGITNSPSRRFGEHRARSDWMLEAGTIRLTRYPDRESVLEAERLMIRAKRPHYNIQHNVDVEVEVELSLDTLVMAGAAVCLSILTLRWLADVSSEWWVRRQAARQGVNVELPPRRDPFSEPSVTLTLLQAFCSLIGGPRPLPPLPAQPVAPGPSQPEPAAATAEPAAAQFPAPSAGFPPGGLAAAVAALCIMFAQAKHHDPGPGPAGGQDSPVLG